MSMNAGTISNSTAEVLGLALNGPVPDLFQVDNLEAFSAGYILLTGILTLLMQLGFAQWETGLSRVANTQNAFMKNLLDSCFAALVFYCVGYGFAFGEGPIPNSFIGTAGFALYDSPHLYQWFMHYTFCNNTASIFGGSLAGRTKLMAYVYVTCFLSGFIYPVCAHWVWARRGWLYNLGQYGSIDFSGAGPVHLLGGTLGLVAAYAVGPRIGFSRASRQRRWREAANKVLAASGAILLWTGWLAFTAATGATVDPAVQTTVSGRIVTVTLLSGTSAAVTSFAWRRLTVREYDLIQLANSLMVGTASITATCAVLQPWAAIVVGSIASLLLQALSPFVSWIGIDDPTDSACVHILGGLWGLLAGGFLADPELVSQIQLIPIDQLTDYGILYGGSPRLLAVQAAEALAISGFTVVAIAPLLYFLSRTGRLRVSKEAELGGLDLFKHDAVSGSGTAGGTDGDGRDGGDTTSRSGHMRGGIEDIDDDPRAAAASAAGNGNSNNMGNNSYVENMNGVSGYENEAGGEYSGRLQNTSPPQRMNRSGYRRNGHVSFPHDIAMDETGARKMNDWPWPDPHSRTGPRRGRYLDNSNPLADVDWDDSNDEQVTGPVAPPRRDARSTTKFSAQTSLPLRSRLLRSLLKQPRNAPVSASTSSNRAAGANFTAATQRKAVTFAVAPQATRTAQPSFSTNNTRTASASVSGEGSTSTSIGNEPNATPIPSSQNASQSTPSQTSSSRRGGLTGLLWSWFQPRSKHSDEVKTSPTHHAGDSQMTGQVGTPPTENTTINMQSALRTAEGLHEQPVPSSFQSDGEAGATTNASNAEASSNINASIVEHAATTSPKRQVDAEQPSALIHGATSVTVSPPPLLPMRHVRPAPFPPSQQFLDGRQQQHAQFMSSSMLPAEHEGIDAASVEPPDSEDENGNESGTQATSEASHAPSTSPWQSQTTSHEFAHTIMSDTGVSTNHSQVDTDDNSFEMAIAAAAAAAVTAASAWHTQQQAQQRQQQLQPRLHRSEAQQLSGAPWPWVPHETTNSAPDPSLTAIVTAATTAAMRAHRSGANGDDGSSRQFTRSPSRASAVTSSESSSYGAQSADWWWNRTSVSASNRPSNRPLPQWQREQQPSSYINVPAMSIPPHQQFTRGQQELRNPQEAMHQVPTQPYNEYSQSYVPSYVNEATSSQRFMDAEFAAMQQRFFLEYQYRLFQQQQQMFSQPWPSPVPPNAAQQQEYMRQLRNAQSNSMPPQPIIEAQTVTPITSSNSSQPVLVDGMTAPNDTAPNNNNNTSMSPPPDTSHVSN